MIDSKHTPTETKTMGIYFLILKYFLNNTFDHMIISYICIDDMVQCTRFFFGAGKKNHQINLTGLDHYARLCHPWMIFLKILIVNMFITS